jgi:hypothetical protein
VLPWLVKYGLNQPCAEATGFSVSCLLGIVEVSLIVIGWISEIDQQLKLRILFFHIQGLQAKILGTCVA